MKRKKTLFILFIFSLIIMLSSCTTTDDPKQKWSEKISYTKIHKNLGFVRIDSTVTSRCNKAIDYNQYINNRYYKNYTYSAIYNTTFKLIYTEQELDNIKNLSRTDSIWNTIDSCIEIHSQVITYDPGWNIKWEYAFFNDKYLAYRENQEKFKNPYIKIFGNFICYRPGNDKCMILKQNSDSIFTTFINRNGNFQETKSNYDFYFFSGKEYAYILDIQNLNVLDSILPCNVWNVCDDNSRFLFLESEEKKNKKYEYYLYDMKNLNLVKDKRSNKKSNLLLETEDVYAYTGFTNEDEFEDTNKLKVWFTNNGKSVTSLLDESSMTHCSETLYEEISNFDNKNFIGFLAPQNVHNVVFTNSNGKVTGTIGKASGSYYGFLSAGHFRYDGSVNLKTSSKQTIREKDNFKLGFLISKKTGKETGTVYQIFDDGQKIRIQ